MKKSKLHKIAPILSEISPKSDIFMIPENYFDSIEDDVAAKIKSQNFKNTSENTIFRTPENYFDTVEDVIIAKLKAEVIQKNKTDSIPKPYFDSIEDAVLKKIKTKSKIFSLKNSLLKYAAPIAIAASILLLIILNSIDNSITLDSIVTTDIEESIEYGLIDIDAENLATIFSEIELTDTDLVASLSDDDVLEYLSNQELDELIYEN